MIHLILITTILLSVVVIKNQNNKRYYLVLSFLLLFFTAALRNDYGNDFEPYQNIFNDAQIGLNSAAIEIGYFWLNKIFPSFHLLLAFLSFIYLAVVFGMILKNVDKGYYWLSVFILVINPYLFLMSLSSLRQTLALCIFIIGLSVKTKSKIKNFIIFFALIILAAQMHQTAWVLLPMYFYFNLKKTPKTELFERWVFIILPIVLIAFSPLLNKLIEIVLGLFSDNLNYLNYITTNQPNSLRSTLLTSIFYVYVLMNIGRTEGKVYQYSRLYLTGLLFSILAFRYSMFGRVQMYFDIFGVISLPMIIRACNKNVRSNADKIINVYIFPMLILVIFILRYYSFFTTPLWQYFFEYKTILSLWI